jgi:hypothetical protein
MYHPACPATRSHAPGRNIRASSGTAIGWRFATGTKNSLEGFPTIALPPSSGYSSNRPLVGSENETCVVFCPRFGVEGMEVDCFSRFTPDHCFDTDFGCCFESFRVPCKSMSNSVSHPLVIRHVHLYFVVEQLGANYVSIVEQRAEGQCNKSLTDSLVHAPQLTWSGRPRRPAFTAPPLHPSCTCRPESHPPARTPNPSTCR